MIEILLQLQQKGVTVTIITSEDVTKRKDVARLLVRQQKVRNAERERLSRIGLLVTVLLLFLVLGGASYDFSKDARISGYVYLVAPLLSISAAYFGTMRLNSYSYSFSIPRLKAFASPYVFPIGSDRSRTLTPHAKVYIIDDEVVYVGSVNLTPEGLFDNLEVSVRIDTPQAIKDLAQYIDGLLMDEYWISYEPTAWGKTLYPEPAR
ncbi:MAG TPA: phospholipase D-like domain-containing protein [Thermoanaerobaculia bacterium]